MSPKSIKSYTPRLKAKHVANEKDICSIRIVRTFNTIVLHVLSLCMIGNVYIMTVYVSIYIYIYIYIHI